MADNVNDEKGIPKVLPEYSNMDQSSEQIRLGAAVQRQAMIGEVNSNFERYEMESDFRNFAEFNKNQVEESIRPVKEIMQANNLKKASKM